MKPNKSREKLLQLFQLCCEKRPDEMLSYHDAFKWPSKYITETGNAVFQDFKNQMNPIVNDAEALMPKNTHGAIGESFPFYLNDTVNSSTSVIGGFVFSEQPPIILVKQRQWISIRLNTTYTYRKRFLRKAEEMSTQDIHNFDKVKSFIQEKIKGLNDNSICADVYETCVQIVKTNIYLCFDELYSEIHYNEYEELKKLRENNKEIVCIAKLQKRIDELKS